MQSNNKPTARKRVKGWIFDVYPSGLGEFTVWIISENDERVRLTDRFQPKIYVSGKEEEIESLASRLLSNRLIAGRNLVYKYAHSTDTERSKVLELVLKDCRKAPTLTRDILRMGDFLRYEVNNSDLHGDRAYLFDHDIFPLAFVEVEQDTTGLRYTLLDSVENVNYTVPSLRKMQLQVEIAKKGKIVRFDDPISKIFVAQANKKITIAPNDEKEKLLELVKTVRDLDPDIILTSGGDSHLFMYLMRRAAANDILDELILSRDNVPLAPKLTGGRTFFSYGRTFYRAPTTRLFGRVHIDENNTFVLNEAGFEGLIEIARTCRVPLHTASRSSIGSSMSSLQLYQALKDDVLIPRNKSIPETFKSAYDLLVGDRGGFVYEPRVGIHDCIGEVDFSAMYPSLMAKNNISAETVLCKCCPDSELRIPDLNYHICEKHLGIVPKTLKLMVTKRLLYKRLREETQDATMKEVYDKRQGALKWILVTCFGYLGYKNAKFGTVDGHIGVCAFGRNTFLKAAHMAEARGFIVIHGIVDSLWLKKENATTQEYTEVCREITEETGVPLNFEGLYKWIVFLPSKVHPRIGVLNRYYGTMENGKIKVRGIEVRRRDTPRFVYDAQMDMIKVLASAGNSKEFMKKIPEALKVVKDCRLRLLDGDVPIGDLIVTKHMSKHPKKYRQHVSQVIAAEQLIKEGAEVHAGNNIRFLFTDAEDKRYERRVRAEQLMEKGINADTKKYLQLLYASTASLLSFSGYTAQWVYDAVRGQGHKNLTDYLHNEKHLQITKKVTPSL
jgi:DNA polymerase elongation subunit (family B)